MLPTMKNILVFDVEATGLIPKRGQKGIMPSITQLCYAMYDMTEGKIVKSYNKYICIPATIPISAESIKVTGITREKLEKEGIPIVDALTEFHKAYLEADLVVGHNIIDYDFPLLQFEAHHYYPVLLRALYQTQKPLFCTMKESTDICKIERIRYDGPYFKWPTLTELYKHLFGMDEFEKIANKLHDAETDVLCCLKCFLYMTEHPELYSS